MKNLAIFLVFLTIGILIMVFYMGQKTVQVNTALIKPTSSNNPTNFSLETAPSESIRGTIQSLSGDVGWQSRIATQPATLLLSQTVQQGEEITTKDNGNVTIQFQNCCLLALSPKTTISLAQTIPQDFVVVQNSGLVQYTKVGTQQLTVRSMDLLVKENSGEMSVLVDNDNQTCVILVLNGSVTMAYNDSDNISTVKTATPGEKFVFNDTNRQGFIQ